MPAYYQYNCDSCDYSARRYRNVRRCKCGGNLIRAEPQVRPNRVVIEMWDDGAWGNVRAERPDEVVIIMHPIQGGYDLVYGEGHIPIDPLGVADGPGEVRFEVSDDN